jgi:peptidoglycan-associated lipoprotein
MKKSTTLIALAFLVAGALPLASGCKKKPPTTTEESRPPVEAPAAPSTRVTPPPAPRTDTDPTAAIMNASIEELNRAGHLREIFFDYDQADLREDARETLAANSEWLKRFGSMQILIEGHADERGTSAYNLALGERRANAAKDYLASLGVDGSRVRTVSYGKERPQCNGQTEDCWQRNRRDNFVITAK